MNNSPQHTRPAWAMISAWLIGLAIAALLGIALVSGESWTEREVLRYAAVFFAVFGVGFLFSSRSPQHPMLFRYFVRIAQRGRRWFRFSGLITGVSREQQAGSVSYSPQSSQSFRLCFPKVTLNLNGVICLDMSAKMALSFPGERMTTESKYRVEIFVPGHRLAFRS